MNKLSYYKFTQSLDYVSYFLKVKDIRTLSWEAGETMLVFTVF